MSEQDEQVDMTSLEEETEDPELVPEDERGSGGVRMATDVSDETRSERASQTIWDQTPEEMIEYVEREVAPEGVEVLDFDFLQSFLSLTDDLHQHPQSRQVFRTMERAVPEFSLRVVENGLGYVLPYDLKSLYQVADALEFRWLREEGGEVQPGGAFKIMPCMRTFGHWVGELWPIDDDLDDDALIWHMRGFDMPELPAGMESQAQVLWTLIAFRDEEEEPGRYDLYAYHPEKKEFLLLNLKVIDYLYCALGACGAPGWQLLFSTYDFEENRWDMPHPESWITMVEEYFPSFDTQFFRDQWAYQGSVEEE